MPDEYMVQHSRFRPLYRWFQESLDTPDLAEPVGPSADCANDPEQKKCAVFAPGKPIKIGFAGPMTGDYSAFGIDSSQAGMLAI